MSGQGTELKEYAFLLLRWWWLITLSMLLAGGIAYVISIQMTPIYSTSTSIRLFQAPVTSAMPDYQSLMTSERLLSTYAEMLKNRSLIEDVIVNLDLPYDAVTLAEHIRVTPIRNTQLLSLKVEDTNAQRAANIANELVAVFAEENKKLQAIRYAESKQNLQNQLDIIQGDMDRTQDLIDKQSKSVIVRENLDALNLLMRQYQNSYTILLERLEELRLAEAQSTDNLIVVEEARAPTNPVRPSPMRNTLLSSIVGVMVAVGGIFLREYLDETIRSDQELEYLTEVPLLAAIATIKGTTEKVIALTDTKSPITEAFRLLQANIGFVAHDKLVQTILVTSSVHGEGKTTLIANLAAVMAQDGKRVILVDTDLRKPMQHHVFGFKSTQPGLTDVLINDANLDDVIVPTDQKNLSLLLSGSSMPPNPAELLSLQRMSMLIEELKQKADVVLFDSSPVLSVVDANLLAGVCDLTLLVILFGSTKSGMLVRSRNQLIQANARIAGTVVNQVSLSQNGFGYGYGYYYYNHAYTKGGKKKK